MEDGRKIVTATLAAKVAGNTYPTGGLLVSAASLGFPSGQIDSLKIVDNNNDLYVYQYNKATGKIVSLVESGTAHHIMEETATSATPTFTITIEAIGY